MAGNMKVNQYVVGPVQTNCYFIINDATKEMICVDPGESGLALAAKARQEGYHPVAVLLTHGHFDHAAGADAFAKEFQIPIYIHEADKETLESPDLNVSWMMGRRAVYHADHCLKTNEVLTLAGMTCKVLYTPGHTPGGASFYFPEFDAVFAGDTLFCGSVGRTDFRRGSMALLRDSILTQLFTLPEQTEVYPGHGEITSIGYEKEYNPYV